MTGPWQGWSPHEAGALNRIAGRRARCGNMNAPCNLGEYISDRPQNNHVRFTDVSGNPLVGADVRVYQATTGPGYGGKTFDTTADLFYTTDANGYVHLPQNPFVSGAMKELIFRVQQNGNVWYRFFEVPAMNIEYWKGNTVDAYYAVPLPAPGSAQEIAVYGYETEIADGDTTPSAADHTEFGAVDVNGGSVTRQYVVKNLGGTRLRTTGSRAMIVGPNASDFTLLSVPSSINVGALSTFQVKFDPKGAGLRRATIQITNDDANEGVYEFSIQGTGVGTPFASLAGGALQLTGTPGDDRLSVSWNGGKVQVMLNDLVEELPAGIVGSIQVAGGIGEDALSFNGASGSDIPVHLLAAGLERYFVNSGRLSVPSLLTGADAVFEVAGDARVTFAASQTFRSLRIDDTATVELSASGAKLIHVDELTVADAARLDLHDNALVIDTDAVTRDAMLDAVSSLVGRARNSVAGPWRGSGITSAAAANDAMRGLAAVLIGDDVWVKYAFNGDVNLDGRINADDYFAIDSGFLTPPENPHYADGDFNYDKRINADDYFLIDSAFLGQDASSASAFANAETTVQRTSAASAADVSEPVRKRKTRRYSSVRIF